MKTKNLIQLLMLAVLLTGYKTNAQKDDRDLIEFNVTSIALEKGKQAKKYKLILYAGGKIVDSVFVKKGGPITISLKPNQVYSMVYEKDSMLRKTVIVNTELPNKKTAIKENSFEFEVELSPDLATQNKEMLDFPVGYIFYNKEKKHLMANNAYHKNVNE